MNEVRNKLEKCLENVKKQIDFVPKVALVLGSGLGALADEIKVSAILSYEDIENFPRSTVEGHEGRFVFGYIEKVPVVIMQGRVHYYEGYSMSDVVLPTRLMKLMGADILVLTNIAGGINYNFKPGDFMLIKDHISNFIPSPLRGDNIDEFGQRFPDMSQVYDEELQKIVKTSARKLNINLKEGVYIQLPGPNLETPAEIRMCKTLGSDAVGMSTVCEAIAAKHMGMRICGISCISNMASGMTPAPLSYTEIFDNIERVSEDFKMLVKDTIAHIV